MSFDPESVTPPGARIKVIGVGGGGGNAVNTMIRSGLEGVDFVAANTDVQALRFSLAGHKIQVGKELTRGLGAGADPDIGRDAALEDRQEIQALLAGADMVFITAGMGGGTGTGGAAVVAQIARELGALTVAVVTKPFGFEGKRRRKHAEVGISRLRECVDTLITIPNQRLLQVASPSLSMIDAFRMADEVLVNAVRGISDIINIPGMVNVDFADVKTVMSCMGQALMGIGAGEGEGRAIDAARQAISSPLLEDIDIEGATGILVNITAGSDVTLMEVNEACSIIQEAAHEDANFIFGTVIDETLGGTMRVTVIATGFPIDKEETEAVPAIATPALRTPGVPAFPARAAATSALVPPKAGPRTDAQQLFGRSHAAPQEAKPTVLDRPVPTMTTAKPAPSELHRDLSPFAFAAAQAEQKIAAPVVEAAPAPAAPAHSALQAPSLSDEAQELTRWTLGDDLEGQDDIPSLANSSLLSDLATGDASEMMSLDHRPSATSAQLTVEQRIEGARALAEDAFARETAAASEGTLADALFEAAGDDQVALHDGEDEFLMSDGNGLGERQGAAKEPAPLESFFEGNGPLIASDIDRKIDEALELAERLKAPRRPAYSDDLDVPAFLRNGMKDLPLD